MANCRSAITGSPPTGDSLISSIVPCNTNVPDSEPRESALEKEEAPDQDDRRQECRKARIDKDGNEEKQRNWCKEHQHHQEELEEVVARALRLVGGVRDLSSLLGHAIQINAG